MEAPGRGRGSSARKSRSQFASIALLQGGSWVGGADEAQDCGGVSGGRQPFVEFSFTTPADADSPCTDDWLLLCQHSDEVVRKAANCISSLSYRVDELQSASNSKTEELASVQEKGDARMSALKAEIQGQTDRETEQRDEIQRLQEKLLEANRKVDKARQDSTGLLLRAADAAVEIQRLHGELNKSASERAATQDLLEAAEDHIEELNAAEAVSAIEVNAHH